MDKDRKERERDGKKKKRIKGLKDATEKDRSIDAWILPTAF
jgi:hypothetical protein